MNDIITPIFNELPEYIKAGIIIFSAGSLNELGKRTTGRLLSFISNLKYTPTSDAQKELVLNGLSQSFTTPQDLSIYYANLLNNNPKDEEVELYIKYFKILSDLSYSDLKLLENAYNNRPYKINNDIDNLLELNIDTLMKNNLLNKFADFKDIFNTDNVTELKITNIGVDFYEKCNNINTKNNISDK